MRYAAAAPMKARPGIALTDHGVMFGAVEFHDSARKHGLTPIIGCEAYIAPRGRFDRTVRDEAHITLLAADDEGYKNLTALISKGFLEGYYYKPRIDMDLLAKHNAGLDRAVRLHVESRAPRRCSRTTARVRSKAAKEFTRDLRRPLLRRDHASRDAGRRHHQRRPDLGRPRDSICRWSPPTIRTTSSRADAQAHDVLLCIGTGKTVADTSRMKFFSDEFYVKSPQEMRELFADMPGSLRQHARDRQAHRPEDPREDLLSARSTRCRKTAAADVAGVLAGARRQPDSTPHPIASSRWARTSTCAWSAKAA